MSTTDISISAKHQRRMARGIELTHETIAEVTALSSDLMNKNEPVIAAMLGNVVYHLERAALCMNRACQHALRQLADQADGSGKEKVSLEITLLDELDKARYLP